MLEQSERPIPSSSIWERIEAALWLEVPVIAGLFVIAQALFTGRAPPFTVEMGFLIGFTLVVGPLLALAYFGPHFKKSR